ncbi:F-type H+-transporting ATPase subunit delta [Luteibacter sp. Sphag1AF]|uniref:F0F1 ATP synthase subunit delta n=1 Tax=Luteibacter sp. Sphag1AF TaxID=2587031 RepID=UPI001619F110|nr:F0F1 ATP synthase subunit delta [Luteibacter sp. Sphag1AF]MBB3226384.1 F-type H+-transporting ATPase subunit delta [Luteibacter sp. Sphag1AF]
MAQALTLARPYARAAFEVAHASGSLADWSRALGFAAAVAADVRVAGLINDPRVLPAQLVALHLPEGMGNDAPFARFLEELAENGRLHLMPEIAALFDELKLESESTMKVRVTSALDLDAAQTESLRASLKRRFKREIELDTHVDAALLGGVVIDTGEQVIDGSARGRLQRLASALTH